MMWVPPTVREELRQKTLAYINREVLQAVETTGPVLTDFNRELHKLDPKLQLVKAKDNAHVAGIIPGYYHLLRLNNGAPPWLQPLMDQDGEFAEPSFQLLGMLRRMDLHNPHVARERMQAQVTEERERQRRRDQARFERQSELRERVDAATKTRVSFNQDARWSQSTNGQRGRRRA